MEIYDSNERVYMKYKALIEYRNYLMERYASETARIYTSCIDTLLSDQLVINTNEIDINKIIDKLRIIKYKKSYANYKNAFLYFCEFQNIVLDKELLNEFKNMSKDKKKKYRKLKPIKLTDIKNHIKVIRDEKLKLSFETMLNTGLRVSELSQIQKQDCIIDIDNIIFKFIGKGGNEETVTISKDDDKNFFDKLKNYIESSKDKKLFYSKSYLQEKAKEKGFTCHDLRRAYAKIKYKELNDIDKVMELLRHDNIKTTKLYIDSKVEI